MWARNNSFFGFEPWVFIVCHGCPMLPCCAAGWVCVFFHVLHTHVHFRATPLASLHLQSRWFSWLPLIVARHVRPYAVHEITTCRTSYVIQLLPSSRSLPAGRSHRRSLRPSQKKYLSKNGVSIGPMFLRSRHMGHWQPVPRVVLVLAFHRIMPALVFDTPMWGVPIAPRRNHMSHMLWTVGR